MKVRVYVRYVVYGKKTIWDENIKLNYIFATQYLF